VKDAADSITCTSASRVWWRSSAWERSRYRTCSAGIERSKTAPLDRLPPRDRNPTRRRHDREYARGSFRHARGAGPCGRGSPSRGGDDRPGNRLERRPVLLLQGRPRFRTAAHRSGRSPRGARGAAPRRDRCRKTFVLTGTLGGMTREDAARLIQEAGGKVSSSVSSKTHAVVAGSRSRLKLDKGEDARRGSLDEPSSRLRSRGPESHPPPARLTASPR